MLLIQSVLLNHHILYKKNFFRHATHIFGSEYCFKIDKFWAKNITQEMLTTLNDKAILLKKIIKLRMAMTLKPKPNYPNGNEELRPKKHVKFSQIWSFCLLFTLTAITWCMINSCHKIVSSIRNTTLKLKQYLRNAQNCGKTNHVVCSMITHYFTYHCLRFWPKNKTVIWPQPPYSSAEKESVLVLWGDTKI